MNKIGNWVFGSFFRTLGRILVYILIAFVLSYLLKDVKLPKINISNLVFSNVYALEDPYIIYTKDTDNGNDPLFNYQMTSNAEFYASTGFNSFNKLSVFNCSSSSICNGSVVLYRTTGGNTFNHTMANYGYDYAHDLNIQLGANHLVSYEYTVCYSTSVTNLSNRIFLNTGVGSGRTNQVSLLHTDYYSINNVSWYDLIVGEVNPYCYTLYNLFVASSNTTTIKVNVQSSAYTNKNVNLVGYKVVDLGATDYLTSTQLNSAISNAGLASASSVNQVQSSVNEVQDQLDDVNGAIQDQISADAQNTQDIIDNQNSNNQAQIDSQKVCSVYDKKDIQIDNKYLSSTGSQVSSTTWGITDYINIYLADFKVLEQYSSTVYMCFYDTNKTLLECKRYNQTDFDNYTPPTNAYYVRASINKNVNKPQIQVCKNGNQAMQDTITNDDSSGATNSASSFFNNFSTNTHGLTGIITAPLNAIQSLTSSSCTPLVLPLPYVNQNLTLPCMRPIYDDNFGDFMIIYDVITLGIISYWVMVRIFGLVKDFKNPEHDEIEVVDL